MCDGFYIGRRACLIFDSLVFVSNNIFEINIFGPFSPWAHLHGHIPLSDEKDTLDGKAVVERGMILTASSSTLPCRTPTTSSTRHLP